MSHPPISVERAGALLARLDLTRLDPGDAHETVESFCRRAATPFGHPAALCIRPEHVGTADRTLRALDLRDRVRVATVANFPGGDRIETDVVAEIDAALAEGADEIDVVLPWRGLVHGDDQRRAEATAGALLAAARAACGPAVMKVILETGALESGSIDRAADLALDHGADFLKTSTGMGPPGASPDAVARLLDRIDARDAACGVKVSGGVRTAGTADAYLRQAEERMGSAWPMPSRFRIGASSLLDDLLAMLDREP